MVNAPALRDFTLGQLVRATHKRPLVELNAISCDYKSVAIGTVVDVASRFHSFGRPDIIRARGRW